MSGAGCSGGDWPAGNAAAARSVAVATGGDLGSPTGLAHVVLAPATGETEAPGQGRLAVLGACQSPPHTWGLGSARVHTGGGTPRSPNPTPTTLGAQIPKAWPGCATISPSTQTRGEGCGVLLVRECLKNQAAGVPSLTTAPGDLTARRRIRWVGTMLEGPCGRGCGLDPLTQERPGRAGDGSARESLRYFAASNTCRL